MGSRKASGREWKSFGNVKDVEGWGEKSRWVRWKSKRRQLLLGDATCPIGSKKRRKGPGVFKNTHLVSSIRGSTSSQEVLKGKTAAQMSLMGGIAGPVH